MRFASMLVLLVAVLVDAPGGAQVLFPPADFSPSPPEAFATFSVTLSVPPGGGRSHTTAGQPRVTISGNVIEVRVDTFTIPFTGTSTPAITADLGPLPPGHYTLRYITDTFFCLGDCVSTGSVWVLTQEFDVVPTPQPIPTLSGGLTMILALFIAVMPTTRLSRHEPRRSVQGTSAGGSVLAPGELDRTRSSERESDWHPRVLGGGLYHTRQSATPSNRVPAQPARKSTY